MDGSPSASPGPPAAVSGARAGRDRRAETYLHLRDLLWSGTLAPDDRLVEVRLAARLGVSRTPVREALVRLAADGLVERRGEGYYPARLSGDELADLVELRATVELRGVARASGPRAGAHDRAALLALRDRWRALRAAPPGPGPAFVRYDEDFHRTLLAASGNPRLTETLESTLVRLRPARARDPLTAERVARAAAEHLAIVEALLAGEPDAALVALGHHLNAGRTVPHGNDATPGGG
ncbi:transcriptional regulator, GntR family [Streptomyces zhaozhouensis]|uniref:Transcriptional regulator, GntR family n=1 Tax=Streptomyces zhaozhouensis TaxID=1300267 RepID=A0A286DZC4_9ACTN|nr:GntR family transcriptional regulator [Streptomyces zhaozhouensis]SOD64007.1 transcriptional regulator, GntR family [Streptomyces zhaozhouensis]